MSNHEDSPHLSRPSSPPLGLRQNVPRNRTLPGSSPIPPTPIPPTLPECPMTEWIRLHPCWHSNASFTRTEETANADSWDNTHLASLVPMAGYFLLDMTFVQHLGLLSDLHERKSCDLCQKIHQRITIDFARHWYKDYDTNVDESEVSCNIVQDKDEDDLYLRIYVSVSFHFYTVATNMIILTFRLARGKADIFMPRIREHRGSKV
jgi:hypothetical protein